MLGQHTWELAKERLAARSQVSVPRMVRGPPRSAVYCVGFLSECALCMWCLDVHR